MTDEYLEIFKAICKGGEISYEGETYQFDPIYSHPPSVQRPHPPILVGGTSNPALRRVSKLADGWLSLGLSPKQLSERLDMLRHFCQIEGRDFNTIRLVHKLFINIGAALEAKDGGREPGTGSIKDVIDDFKCILDLGYQSFIIRYRGEDQVEQQRQISLFATKIAPHLR